jgi:hypothetical protein
MLWLDVYLGFLWVPNSMIKRREVPFTCSLS